MWPWLSMVKLDFQCDLDSPCFHRVFSVTLTLMFHWDYELGFSDICTCVTLTMVCLHLEVFLFYAAFIWHSVMFARWWFWWASMLFVLSLAQFLGIICSANTRQPHFSKVINMSPTGFHLAWHLTHWGRDKWMPFRRWHFQLHFLEWKCLNSD